jgi:DNA-binding IclR family transcriptional regulator
MGRNDALTGMASVRKAFAVLDVVASNSRGMSAKEISEASDMPLPSVYRLLKTLVTSEHLVHLKEHSRYGLGYKLHALDTSLRRQVGTPPAVARVIRELHVRADAAAYYAVHRGDDIIVAHVVESPARPRITPMGFGFNDAAHATAFGKVLLAAMEDDQRQAYLQRHGLPEMTPLTIQSTDKLEAELANVQSNGIAVEREEFFLGAACLAAPVTNLAGQTIGSVAISTTPADFAVRAGMLSTLLRDAADKASRALRGTTVLGT